MRFRNNILGCALVSALALLLGSAFQSCEDQPDKYKVSSGTPTIYYARLSRVSSKDSLITGAYMGQNVTFVGNNLRSITKMYFNDQEAVLNESFITSNTLLVDVPNTLSNNPTDKIYMVNKDGDTTVYNFKVLVPNPVVSALSNEYAADGDTVTLTGDYLLNYSSSPLQITMPGNVPVTKFISYSKTAVTFVVPAGSQKGFLSVTSKYGKSQSSFYFRDDRFVLFDWDGNGKALASGHGWRNGNTTTSIDGVNSLSGKFLYFKGALQTGVSWNDENAFSFDYWPDPTNGYPELSSMFDASNPSNLDLKFEVNVPNVWDIYSMQIIFTGNSEVTYATANNNYIGNASYPRALWTPWYDSVKKGIVDYTTKGWTTVTIPLSDFKYGPDGSTLTALSGNHFTGLTFFVNGGPYTGAACSPTICIDNIRIAPIK